MARYPIQLIAEERLSAQAAVQRWHSDVIALGQSGGRFDQCPIHLAMFPELVIEPLGQLLRRCDGNPVGHGYHSRHP